MDSIKSSFFSSRRKSVAAPKTPTLQLQQQQLQSQVPQMAATSKHSQHQQDMNVLHNKMDGARLDLNSSVSYQQQQQQQQSSKPRPPPLRKIPVRDFESYSPPPIMTAPIYGSSKFTSSSPPPYFSPSTSGNVNNNSGGRSSSTHQTDYIHSYNGQDSFYFSPEYFQQQSQQQQHQHQQTHNSIATGGNGIPAVPRATGGASGGGASADRDRDRDCDRERDGGLQPQQQQQQQHHGSRSRPVSQYQQDLSSTSFVSSPNNSTMPPLTGTPKSRRPKSLAAHEYGVDGMNGSAETPTSGADGTVHSMSTTYEPGHQEGIMGYGKAHYCSFSNDMTDGHYIG
ncbi:hypothetical protein EDD11_006027 [Mortierella claussenii]|nr:hypothetical protein EDD11_006027 [Mortierella claussenii]